MDKDQELVDFLPAARMWLDRLGFSVSDAVDAVFDPVESWGSPRSAGHMSFVGASGIGVYADVRIRPVILSVKRADDLPRPKQDQRWRRGGGSHRAHSAGMTPRELTDRLAELGCDVRLRPGGHFVVSNERGRLTVPASPSDHRWFLNAVSDARRVLGVEVRGDG